MGSAPCVRSAWESVMTLVCVNPVSPVPVTSAPLYTGRKTVLGSLISWLSFPHNFSQKSYNQKFLLFKINMSGTTGFFSSFFLLLFHCSESSQSFLYPSCIYLHFNTGMYHHVSKYCISLSCPAFPSMELNTLLSALWSSDHLAVSQYLFACLLCVAPCQFFLFAQPLPTQTFSVACPYITGKP